MIMDTAKTSAWTTQSLLAWTANWLKQARIDSPRLCAEILLAHVLGCRRIDLYMRFDQVPNARQRTAYRELIRRCADQEPVGYLTGKAHFYSLEFSVSGAVLIPRPETEQLVVQAIEFLRGRTNRRQARVLDLGTGSGCIAVAIATSIGAVELVGVDISGSALSIARKNVEAHNLQERMALQQGDLFEALEGNDQKGFDLIVSNPPYICTQEYERLEATVRDFEPRQALLAKENGLAFHRRIIHEAPAYLVGDGTLMLETAYNQAEAVIELFNASDSWGKVATGRDHLGHLRVVTAAKL